MPASAGSHKSQVCGGKSALSAYGLVQRYLPFVIFNLYYVKVKDSLT